MDGVLDFPGSGHCGSVGYLCSPGAAVALKRAETIRTIEGATGGKTGKDNNPGESKGRGNIESGQAKSGRRQAEGYREDKREAGGENRGWKVCQAGSQ
ncbi:hypothetical protein NKI56_27470 [Mesorhizobium sp. M0622]|uniref:hypothetical protein n=1 Tax=unclassified Mesorhizobium TaxID=325217 RepID=UPI00333A88BD